jgi:hypothetical protein
MVNKLSPTLFARKCDRQPATGTEGWRSVGCLLWRGSCQTSGYGTVRAEGATLTAHRASWLVHNGPIPLGQHVLHHCDVRRCCEPAHLFLGDAKANHDDMMQKKRNAKSYAAHTRQRKLTAQDVERILSGRESPKELAAALGVHRSTVSQIRNGRRKQHVAQGLPRREPRHYQLDKRRLAPRVLV